MSIHTQYMQTGHKTDRTENNTIITYMRKRTHKRHKKVRKTERLPTSTAWSSRRTQYMQTGHKTDEQKIEPKTTQDEEKQDRNGQNKRGVIDRKDRSRT